MEPQEAAVEGTTLSQYLLNVARERVNSLEGEVRHSVPDTLFAKRGGQDGVLDLVTLLQSIKLAIKSVGSLVRSAGIPGSGVTVPQERGKEGDIANGSRLLCQELNAHANQIWINALLYSQRSCVLVSEELPDPVIVQEDMQGKYAVVFDPLTGLSDPPAQNMGAIFGIFRQLSGGNPGIVDVMQPARNLVAAGYALYGACTVLMFSAGYGAQQFVLDTSLNEFILTEPNVTLPYSGAIYSINEGYAAEYDSETQEMLKCLKAEPAMDGRSRTCRYIGSMVADIHRTFKKGGIFMYPPHQRGFPNGRLKLLYEAGPMAYLVSQAGGQASTGTEHIIDIVPDSIHTRVPVFLGSEDDVNFATGFYNKKAPWGRSDQDPMFMLRRTLSREEKKRELPKSNTPRASDVVDDGIIAFHIG
ncbi:Fructose-1,6-bisphosphatase 1 [Gracilariopsis chorda]|uniref:fructose-bisphosphatase n=1 Tax=Gracilariopsis chorda TaxID=448386 RepID=A0A2V3IZU9_9FLOR|nr:Fructose-1,6-bisphosphatase 1 [Gracilariopsis chorda]|eukprot:PXF47207.1 Fructose-1,6-bisphosphatase 1 [Gracilariopsis chorda]